MDTPMLGYDLSSDDRLDILGNRLEKFNNYNGRPISVEEVNGDMLHLTFTRKINDDLNLRVLGNFLNTDYIGPADATPTHPDSADRMTKFQQWPNRELGMKVEVTGNIGERHHFAAGVEWRRNDSSRTTWYGDHEVLEFDVRGTQDIYSVFLEDKIVLGNLEVTPGVRLEEWKDNASRRTTTRPSPTTTWRGCRQNSATSRPRPEHSRGSCAWNRTHRTDC